MSWEIKKYKIKRETGLWYFSFYRCNEGIEKVKDIKIF